MPWRWRFASYVLPHTMIHGFRFGWSMEHLELGYGGKVQGRVATMLGKCERKRG
jgi:hypothetical protein